MADERYKTVSMFALPDEYQRQASEARRRRRMAEMLAQQAYQPGDIQNAPIPRGAPLVRGLQAFLAARAARKADEAEEGAMKAQTQEARDFLNTLTRPREDFDKTMNLGQVLQIGTPELVDGQLRYPDISTEAPNLKMIPQEGPRVQLGRKPEDDQVYMPAAVSRFTATGRETDPQRMAAMLANPEFKSSFTDEQLLEKRRNLALEGMLTSQNPLVQQIGQMQYALMQPKQPEIGAVSPADFTPESLAEYQRTGNFGVLKMRDQPAKPEAMSGLGRMIAERKAIFDKDPTDPRIADYDKAIEKETRIPTGSSVNITNIPPMNENQANAAGFADRIANALPVLDSTSPGRSARILENAPLSVGNEFLSGEAQQFFQAERDFINAVLRRESGAVISEEEFDNARRQYIPQPGDKDEVLEQKRRNRQTVLRSMGRAAGPSYQAAPIAPPIAPAAPTPGGWGKAREVR